MIDNTKQKDNSATEVSQTDLCSLKQSTQAKSLSIVNSAPLNERDVYQLGGQVLAFIGDSVQSLFVKTYFVKRHDYKTHKLHIEVSKHIRATAQAKGLDAIIDSLSEREKSIYTRGRNAKINTASKKADLAQYKKSTGLEAVIGYLYLIGDNARLNDLLEQLLTCC
ncbi:MAG: Mini-ribonuclease 3 [Firmicutes bacterium]|nr:Mini-ribonuclease 3 [Bacillota bacterium]